MHRAHAEKTLARIWTFGLLLLGLMALIGPARPAGAVMSSPAMDEASRQQDDAWFAQEEAKYAQSESLLLAGLKPWHGDLDGMVKRRFIRVLVPYDKVMFFIGARGQQMGVSHDLMKAFEKELNKELRARGKLKTKAIKVQVVFIPVSRDKLISGLQAGIGDVAAANLTITAQRAKLVDFTTPFTTEVREVLVTGPKHAPVTGLEQLSGLEVATRKSASYYESLVKLNQRFKAEGRKPVRIIVVPEDLEDGDLAEMVSLGIYKATVLDRYMGLFWRKIFTNLQVHEDAPLREGASIAFAVRKNCPQLKQAMDAFVARNKVGTAFTNVVVQKYLRNTSNVKNVLSAKNMARFRQTVEFLRKYANQYQFDWLLIAAQGYQESGLDNTVRSPVGAVGVMQVMPETAAGSPINIAKVHELENNIHAGVKYLRFMTDEYFDDPAISVVNRHLFAFASYNAGPNRINRLRAKAAKHGLDPNKWFQNVEVVAARYVGAETTQYVGNIFKYYVAYKQYQAQHQRRAGLAQQPPAAVKPQ